MGLLPKCFSHDRESFALNRFGPVCVLVVAALVIQGCAVERPVSVRSYERVLSLSKGISGIMGGEKSMPLSAICETLEIQIPDGLAWQSYMNSEVLILRVVPGYAIECVGSSHASSVVYARLFSEVDGVTITDTITRRFGAGRIGDKYPYRNVPEGKNVDRHRLTLPPAADNQ